MSLPIYRAVAPEGGGVMVEVKMSVASSDVAVPMSMDASYMMIDTPIYHGAYTYTPTSETQVISIHGQMAERDIVIDPVPSAYGRVTWNGSYLTVS